MDTPWDGANAFGNRAPFIRETLKRLQPDLIGFQEVLPHMKRWLEENLPEYLILGPGRGRRYEDETTAVAVRRDALDVVAFDTFWLSETPDVPGSRYSGDQSICPRICVWALLADRRTARQVYLFNTHLDHEGADARVRGIGQILETMDRVCARRPAPVILTGDFNDTPDSETVRRCLRHTARDASGAVPGSAAEAVSGRAAFTTFRGVLRDVASEYGVGATYHGYHPETAEDRIDYIITNLPALSCQALTETQNGLFLSDHYPVAAELALCL